MCAMPATSQDPLGNGIQKAVHKKFYSFFNSKMFHHFTVLFGD